MIIFEVIQNIDHQQRNRQMKSETKSEMKLARPRVGMLEQNSCKLCFLWARLG